MTAYYNEIDPFAAEWLRQLIAAGHIAPGIVDERSIEDIKPDELKEFTQCHFFAGIGVWSYALRQAGWPDDRPIWTGSCPYQPFSAAGKGAGFTDERHLWPHWFHLISQCEPTVIFGEQVASKIVEPWIDLVQADLEAMDYAFGCVPFPSAGIGAPHLRDRAYWVAHSEHSGFKTWKSKRSRAGSTLSSSIIGGMEHANLKQQQKTLFDSESEGRRDENTIINTRLCSDNDPAPVNGYWSDADWLGCRDGKWRPVEPKSFPLAHGITNRVGKLRGYGNAINAEAAKEFIMAFNLKKPRLCLKN